MVAIGGAFLLVFFYIYLPSTTNHKETITVPELVGMSFEDIDEYVTNRNLRYEILSDSGYAETMDPLTILTQNPKAGSKVKENRKIYLSLNAKVPPKVRMPNLINTSRANAEDILISNGLKLGEIEYVPNIALNAVLEQKVAGNEIASDSLIPKGSIVDLVIGDGLGNQNFETPDFMGNTLDEVKFVITDGKLILDHINYIKQDTLPANMRNRIYKQLPPAGSENSSGGRIEIWINADPPEKDDGIQMQ
jgi:eukaryotic-like serine/threonine-protein kinase